MARISSYTREFREEAVRLVIESGRPIAHVARELEINSETLRNWVRRYQRDHADTSAELSINDRARLAETRTAQPRTGDGKQLPEKSRSVLREGTAVTAKYEFIDQMRLDIVKYAYPVVFMCRLLGVSTSGYYEWRNRPETATVARRKELMRLVQTVFADSDATYGHRRVHAQLVRWGVACTPELVRALMRQDGLAACQPRPRRHLTVAAAAAADDLVCRDFTAPAPGTKLVGDITYIPTGQGWLYLATVIDCCTKEIIGYATDDHYKPR